MNAGRSRYTAQADDLSRLTTASRRRRLIAQEGVDFSSNDYLGLAASGLLADAAREALDRGVPTGSGGSRLLRGNHAEHEALEAEAAAFFGSESAIWFSTGFAANSALLSTLPQRGDLIVHDELVHASAHEGLRLGRAEAVSARHNDLEDFEAAIRRYRLGGGTGTVWIAIESLYSMDGDIAPIDALVALADRHDAVLLVDEAHATGVFGAEGRGLAGHVSQLENVITLRTCGKALGTEGALLCGPKVMRDFLINRGRGFIFSTAPSPLMAAVTRAALRIVQNQPQLREELWTLVRQAETVLGPLGAMVSGSQIVPVIIGEDARTMALAEHLQAAGLDVRGIRPPTVPEGTSRLRVSITRNVSGENIAQLGDMLAEALAAQSGAAQSGADQAGTCAA
jgi:8-amino-7-oxononanoate synthase